MKMRWVIITTMILFGVGASCSPPDPCQEGLGNIAGEVVVCDTSLDKTSVPRTRAAGMTLSATTASVNESGTTATATLSLADEPTSNVYIDINSSDTSEVTVLPSSMVFTPSNWSSTQTITMTGVDDGTQDGDITSTIAIGINTSSTDDTYYDAVDNKSITVTTADDDVISYVLNTTSATVTELGSTANFNIKLGLQPTGNVVIDLTASDTTEATVSPSSFTFTTGNWNTAQVATITGVYDTSVDGNVASTITASINDGSSADEYDPLADQTVSVSTTDSGHTIGYTVSKTTASVSETGSTETFTVVLQSIPTSNVVIDITDNDSTEIASSPTSLTFTNGNWNTAQTVTITGQDDNIVDGSKTSLVTISVNDGSSFDDYDPLADQTITVTTADSGDSAGVSISKTSSTVTEGNTDTFTVSLTSEPIANTTFTVSSGDTTEVTISPASLTFTSGDWNTPQTVTITGVQDNERDMNRWTEVTVGSVSTVGGDYASQADTTVTVQVNDTRTGRQPDQKIDMGKSHGCAIDKDTNNVYCWGDDMCTTASNYGFCDYNLADDVTQSTVGSGQIIPQAADNSHMGDNSTTTPVDVGITGITSIHNSDYSACALHTNRDNVTCWGRYRSNSYGTNNSNSIWNLTWTANQIAGIDMMFEGGCAILDNGTVACWGYGRHGEIGDGSRAYDKTIGYPSISSTAVDIASGTTHTCALLSTGAVQCWGKDNLNQLGDADAGGNAGVCDSNACSLTPVNLDGGITNFIKIDAGGSHTCGLLDNGTVYCWGANDSYQLGNTGANSDTPVLVSGLTNVDDIFIGGARGCALTDNRTIMKCWGDNYLGDGSSGESGTPVVVTKQNGLSASTRIDEVAISNNTCIYVDATEDVYCWGGNTYGELGTGDTTLRTTMEKVGSPF